MANALRVRTDPVTQGFALRHVSPDRMVSVEFM